MNLNYSYENNDVFYAFQSTGDAVYSNAFLALGRLLSNGVRVALYYGYGYLNLHGPYTDCAQ